MIDEDDEPRIDMVTGEYERIGMCEACGRRMKQSKTIKAPSFELVQRQAEAWSESPIAHRRCP